MNLALVYCHKEWRAQRGVLIAYTLLVFACLSIGLMLTPSHVWMEDGFGVHALSWFVAAGVIGVVMFVAPALVRAEFHGKDDQFVRRLPGALGPAFCGKLLFLALAAIALPLLGLAIGELFVTLSGYCWDALFHWDWTGEVRWEIPLVTIGCGVAMLLAPWVWAIGTWLPRGLMAVGGTVLFVLLVAVAVYAALRQSPGLQHVLDPLPWLWAVAPLGLLVAAVSWCRGRRGGGVWRSARSGLAVVGLGLLPPAIWLGQHSWDYHQPNLQNLRNLSVLAVSSDGERALARGAEQPFFEPVSLAIDLRTGEAEQLAGIDTYLTWSHPDLRLAAQSRYWLAYRRSSERVDRAYDLQTGTWCAVGYDPAAKKAVLSAELRTSFLEACRPSLRSADHDDVWIEGPDLCSRTAEGKVARQRLPGWPVPAGHGVRLLSGRGVYDLRGRRVLEDGTPLAWVVGDRVVYQPDVNRRRQWFVREVGEEAVACEALERAAVFGLFDDERLLCAQKNADTLRLFLFAPASGTVEELELPESTPHCRLCDVQEHGWNGSLLRRDPAGCIWLLTHDDTGETYLRLDTATRAVTVALEHRLGDGSYYRLLGWPDAHHVLVSQDERILRFDLRTRERTVLFPKESR